MLKTKPSIFFCKAPNETEQSIINLVLINFSWPSQFIVLVNIFSEQVTLENYYAGMKDQAACNTFKNI